MPKHLDLEYEIDANGCWICTSHRPTKRGYAKCWCNGKKQGAHRIMYERFKGPIPDDLVVRHTCDVRLCINPDHLVVGTAADNNRDMMQRGRQRFLKGEALSHAKLSEEQVLFIREHSEIRGVEVARILGISTAQVSCIRTGKYWKDAPGAIRTNDARMKLSDEQVAFIMAHPEISGAEMGRRLGISGHHVNRIREGKNRKGVSGPMREILR